MVVVKQPGRRRVPTFHTKLPQLLAPLLAQLGAAGLEAWRNLPKLRDPGHFEAWTYRLVVHACYAEARRIRVWHRLRLLAATEPRARDESVDVVNRDVIARGFKSLSTQHRAVLVLHHHVGMPLTEVATLLELPVGTVRSRLHYASRALRSAIERDDAIPAQGVT